MIDVDQVEALGENVKVVIFIESEPLSDRFNQIMLTQEQRKRMLEALRKEMRPLPGGGFDVWMSNVHEYTFPNIKDDYTTEEILDPES